MIASIENEMGHVTLARPFYGWFVIRRPGFDSLSVCKIWGF